MLFLWFDCSRRAGLVVAVARFADARGSVDTPTGVIPARGVATVSDCGFLFLYGLHGCDAPPGGSGLGGVV